jgi:LysM repeat protein
MVIIQVERKMFKTALILKRVIWLVLALSVALPSAMAAPAQAAPAPAPAADGPNLLQNPGFEQPYVKQCCQTDLTRYHPNTPIDEVQVASGWGAWWQAEDEFHPGSCSTPGCIAWHRPEWRDANCGEVCANRVRSGSNAQKYFTFHSVHEAGMYQRVGGVAPGQRLRFSIHMHAWSSNVTQPTSSGQSSMGMRVGIDPFGGTNPWSGSVIWSPVFDSYDQWALYSVEAVARAGTITVFTRSRPDWPVQHNDVYLDDASLVVVGAAPAAPRATPVPGSPAPTAAPTPASGFIYTVQPGDSFFRIARNFGVSLQALLAANPTATPNILFVGTRLLIPGVSGPPAGAPGVTPPPSTGGPAPTATLSPLQQPGAFAYVVQRGDNLYRLSLRFGTTIARIKQLNRLTSDVIFIGQTLVIAP